MNKLFTVLPSIVIFVILFKMECILSKVDESIRMIATRNSWTQLKPLEILWKTAIKAKVWETKFNFPVLDILRTSLFSAIYFAMKKFGHWWKKQLTHTWLGDCIWMLFSAIANEFCCMRDHCCFYVNKYTDCRLHKLNFGWFVHLK